MLFVIVSVIYRPIEQLLSRTIADRRARGHRDRPPAPDADADPGRRSRSSSWSSRWSSGPDPERRARRLGGAVLGAGRRRARLRGELLRPRLAGRAPVVRALRRARVPRGHRAAAVRGRGAIGIAEGQSVVAMGMAAAPFVSLVVVPLAFSRRPREATRPHETDEEALGLARGGRFAVAVLVIMLAEQTLLNGGVIASTHRRRRRRRGLRVQRAADRARAAAALPGGPGFAPPPPRRARGHARDGPSSSARSGSRSSPSPASRARSRSGCCSSARSRWSMLFEDEDTLRALRARRGRARDGRPPGRGHAQPGRARPRPRGRRRRGLAGQRRRVRRLDVARRRRRRARPAPRSATSARRCCCVRCSRWSTAGLLRHPRRPPEATAAASGHATRPEPLTMPGVTQPAMSPDRGSVCDDA